MTDDTTVLRNAINEEARRIYYEGGGIKVLRKSIRDIAIELTLSGWRPVDPALLWFRGYLKDHLGRTHSDEEKFADLCDKIDMGVCDDHTDSTDFIAAFRAGVAHAEGHL